MIIRRQPTFLPGITLTAAGLLICLTGWIRAGETNRLSGELVIPLSHFVSEGDLGKDPFFPNSIRLHKKAADDPGKAQPVRLDFSRLLRLTGVTGGAKPIANINNLTFAVGEEQDVKIEGGKVKIRVVEIREKSVTVNVENQAEPIVLNLRDVQLDFTKPSQPSQ